MATPVHSRDYFEASRERMNQAGQLYRSQQYSIAMYLAGVAVECMLRAFHFDREFNDRHNIELMFGACDSEKLGAAAKVKMRGPIQTVHLLWQNRYRFFSESRLRAHIQAIGQDKRGVFQGADFLKVRCRDLHDASNAIITVGVERWQQI
jgi:hypothetical protein